MAAVATEKWSAKTKGDEVNGSTVVENGMRVWTVTGAANEAAAKNACALINDPYESGSTCLCRSRTPRQISIGLWEVTAQYQTPPNGTWETTSGLSAPAIYSWQTTVVSEPCERDIHGNPITNSAGDAPSNPGSRTYLLHTLAITKNFAYFDYATWSAYENRLNSTSVTYTQNGHTITIPAGNIKVCTIQPARPYTSNDLYVPVTASLEIWDTLQEDIVSGTPLTYAHQLRFMDQGKNGWATVSGSTVSGPIVRADYTVPGCDVRLDGTGKPLDAQYKIMVGDKLYAPVAKPSPLVSTYMTVETGTSATFLKAKRYAEADLSALFSAFS